MSKGGYLLIVRDEERQYRISSRIELEKDFTVVIPANHWKGSERAVALVSLNSNSLLGLCLVERGNRVATYQVRLKFTNFIPLKEGIQFSAILESMSNHVKRYFEQVIESQEGGWITAGTWDEIIRVISEMQSGIESSVEEINSLIRVQQPNYDNDAYSILSREKDAYASIVRYAGFESVAESSVKAWRLQRSQNESDTLSFVATIQAPDSVTIREDQAIEYDATKFGDWDQIEQFITGERIFSKGKESLMIRNVNRQPLEKTLGVDLIYFNHTYRSFILVQYKRMLRENNEYRYRPDSQFAEELKRMQEFREEVATLDISPSILSEYRLNEGAFYFKFHDSEIFDPVNASLIKGMHVPLDYWELFDASEQSKGPKGGKYVGYDNIGRYLNNTEFEYMVAKGLVGSYGTVTDLLVDIVQPLVTELKHSVTVGIKYGQDDNDSGDEAPGESQLNQSGDSNMISKLSIDDLFTDEE